MRDYSKVSSSFWTGRTGKALRGNQQAQIVALYLMTCPHANMIGVFHCPLIYIAHETGSPIEGAMEGLNYLLEGAFCTYDEESETVWVHEMARFQIGEKLSPNDKQIIGIKKQYENLPEGLIKQGFYERYKDDFSLPIEQQNKPNLPSPLQAPSMPEAGTEAVAESGTGKQNPSRTSALDESFDEFWNSYPKKVGKDKALLAWKKKKPPIQRILQTLEWQVPSEQWTKQNGAFIPNPTTYINEGRWQDQPMTEVTF